MVAASSETLAADVTAFGGLTAEAAASILQEHADSVGLVQRLQKISQLPEAPSVILEKETIS